MQRRVYFHDKINTEEGQRGLCENCKINENIIIRLVQNWWICCCDVSGIGGVERGEIEDLSI
jgi:hypothetical protein